MRRAAPGVLTLCISVLLLTKLEAREFHSTPLTRQGLGLKEDKAGAEREPSQHHAVHHHHISRLEAHKNETATEQNVTTAEKTEKAPLNNHATHHLGNASARAAIAPPVRSKKLDIVIAHYDLQRIGGMKEFWLWFFDLNLVRVWDPYVYMYTQSQEENIEEELKPFLKHGGEVVRLENAGRESHVYLQHISRKYDDLANHTLFAQDAPNIDLLPKKFEKLFEEKTGFLPLSFMGHVDCFESWNNIIPPKVMPQLYGMLTHSLCPPTGYAAGFEGQFIVSRQRILDQPLTLYRHLIDMVAAPADHWVHEYHNYDVLKDQTNPYMGHALERAWSLAFNCYEVWRQQNCYDCQIFKNHEDCGRDACQCFDVA